MKILFDLNVLVDVAARWQRYPESLSLYETVLASTEHQGAFAGCGYMTLYYILERVIEKSQARATVAHLSTTLELIPFTPTMAAQAHRLQMTDLEDACIAASALESGCDVIATRNLDDFYSSPIPARMPASILKLIRRDR